MKDHERNIANNYRRSCGIDPDVPDAAIVATWRELYSGGADEPDICEAMRELSERDEETGLTWGETLTA